MQMADLTLNEINLAIKKQEWTNEELVTIVKTVNYARAQLGKKVLRSLRRGSKVQFTNSRNGMQHVGIVTDIKVKKASVRVGAINWLVPGEMLTKVAA